MKPTAWIRSLIEQARDGGADVEQRVSALEAALSSIGAQPQTEHPRRSTASPNSIKGMEVRHLKKVTTPDGLVRRGAVRKRVPFGLTTKGKTT